MIQFPVTVNSFKYKRNQRRSLRALCKLFLLQSNTQNSNYITETLKLMVAVQSHLSESRWTKTASATLKRVLGVNCRPVKIHSRMLLCSRIVLIRTNSLMNLVWWIRVTLCSCCRVARITPLRFSRWALQVILRTTLSWPLNQKKKSLVMGNPWHSLFITGNQMKLRLKLKANSRSPKVQDLRSKSRRRFQVTCTRSTLPRKGQASTHYTWSQNSTKCYKPIQLKKSKEKFWSTILIIKSLSLLSSQSVHS